MIATCQCQHCGAAIEFAAELFQPGAVGHCRECGQESALYIASEFHPTRTKPKPEANQFPPAHVNRVEDRLETVAILYFGGSILGGVVALAGALIQFEASHLELGFAAVITGVVIIGQGVIFRAVIDGLAEIIRLLRKQTSPDK